MRINYTFNRLESLNGEPPRGALLEPVLLQNEYFTAYLIDAPYFSGVRLRITEAVRTQLGIPRYSSFNAPARRWRPQPVIHRRQEYRFLSLPPAPRRLHRRHRRDRVWAMEGRTGNRRVDSRGPRCRQECIAPPPRERSEQTVLQPRPGAHRSGDRAGVPRAHGGGGQVREQRTRETEEAARSASSELARRRRRVYGSRTT